MLHAVQRDDIYVVPNFISEGYFPARSSRANSNWGRVTRRGGRVIKYCDPVGSHERMTER